MPVSASMVPSASASRKTLKRRVQQVQAIRSNLDLSITDELQIMPLQERAEKLKEVALPITIPTKHSLAMKANLSLPWNKLRCLQR